MVLGGGGAGRGFLAKFLLHTYMSRLIECLISGRNDDGDDDLCVWGGCGCGWVECMKLVKEEGGGGKKGEQEGYEMISLIGRGWRWLGGGGWGWRVWRWVGATHFFLFFYSTC